MPRVIPTVARILHYFPAGMRDGVMITRAGALRPPDHPGPLPLAAIVVDVINEDVVNLTVFDGLGAVFSRVHVPMVQDGNPWSAELCAAGWCEWPKLSQAPQVRQATDGGRNPNYRPPAA